jgi:hypothetical protein
LTGAGILARLRDLGVTAEARGDGLALRPASLVPDDLRREVKANKPELLALLAANDVQPDPLAHAAVPTDPAGLLSYIRDTLHCRVWIDGDMLRISPTHRCPPSVVAAAMAVRGELAELLAGEPSPIPTRDSTGQSAQLAQLASSDSGPADPLAHAAALADAGRLTAPADDIEAAERVAIEAEPELPSPGSAGPTLGEVLLRHLAGLRAAAGPRLPPSSPSPIAPPDRARCTGCGGSTWWTERPTPWLPSRGWRCRTCHPPDGLSADAVLGRVTA